MGGAGGEGSCGGELNRYSSNMKLPKLTAVIEKEESWFVAHCPELGVTSQGRTIPEAEAMIQEAVDRLVDLIHEHGKWVEPEVKAEGLAGKV